MITTNCDGQFLKNGFDSKKVFEVQGSYSKLQCEKGCHNKLYDNKDLTYKMLKNTNENLEIPAELVPKCPVCGGRMAVNLRCDDHFVEDEHWNLLQKEYDKFLNEAFKKNVLLLEFGVGFNTPGIIRFPFEEMAFINNSAKLIRFNKDYPNVPHEIKNKSIEVDIDIKEIVKELTKK